jgi:two-component system, chemotaxis family, sensor histidine kinase and response regulator WspE
MSGDLSGFSMFELFKAEAETHARTLSDGLLALEARPDELVHVESLMRAAHSIKGAARIIRLDPLVELAHAMEDCFVAVGQGDQSLPPARVDQLLRGVDLFQELAVLSEDQLNGWLEAHRDSCASLAAEVRQPLAMPEVTSGSFAEPPDEPRKSPPSTGTAEDREAALDGEPSLPAGVFSPTGAVGAAGKAEEAPTGAKGPMPETPGTAADDRAVAVSAANLNRILRLASESMIEAHHLQAMTQSLNRLRNVGRRLFSRLEQAGAAGPDVAGTAWDDVKRLQEGWDRLLQEHTSELEAALWQSERTSTALYHEVLGSRMRPFSEGTTAFPRMIRDLARALGKGVSFEVQGGSVAVDRDILRKLEAPLNHLLRNCVDHGLEAPDGRRAAGKPETGKIVLSARHHAGMLTVEVRDDGRGIDSEAVRRKVLDRQLATPDLVARLGRDELFEFLFLPGFTTAGTVTEVSGRGVGLDVVRSMVQEVSGSVRVESEPGRSTAFTLRLPVTLSVVRAALAEISGEPYAFPLSRLQRILRVDVTECRPVQGRQQLLLDGHSVGLISAAEILGLPELQTAGDVLSVMVLGEGEQCYGLMVDRFLGEQGLVVRPLDSRLGRVPHISSAAITEAGQPLLIVDVEDLLRSMQQHLAEGRLHGLRSLRPVQAGRAKRVLVVDDSLTVREVERQLLKAQGYEVDVAVDGRDGWTALSSGHYDLLVTDVDMPRMNGIELIRAVREDDRLAELPVIVVSYKDREQDRLLGLEAGANAYLTKGSFHDDTFITTVRDLMEDLDGCESR